MFSYFAQKFVDRRNSYLDVLIISSVFPASFITSVEIAKDFFLGTLARLGGSIFVERRRKIRLLKDIDAVSNVLSSNLNVVLFPEGTSTPKKNYSEMRIDIPLFVYCQCLNNCFHSAGKVYRNMVFKTVCTYKTQQFLKVFYPCHPHAPKCFQLVICY